jgi:hypothetical protein
MPECLAARTVYESWLRELKPGTFLALIINANVVDRLGLILITPGHDQNIDLSIYREELVVNGVDPYRFLFAKSLCAMHEAE